MPSLTPSSSGQPSSEPSFVPSESSQPSSMPSESLQPSSMPSLVPSESLQPSSMPSVAPSVSAQPSFTRATKILNLLLTVSSEDALDDEDSPQGKANLWVTTSPLQPGEDDAQIIQQYILAVFYYATGGAGWNVKEGWLESSNECTWDHVDCSGDVVTHLSPAFNIWLGASQVKLVAWIVLENRLTGGIPTELGELDSLETSRDWKCNSTVVVLCNVSHTEDSERNLDR
eukprot:scaffold20320_cov112-Skeletonema_dohrnii-CCMP3373.AAC.9